MWGASMFEQNRNSFLEFHQNWIFLCGFFKLHIEVYYIFFKCSRELQKMYHFIFKCREPKQKLYCFIFTWPFAKRTIQSCYDSSAMPPREPYGPLLRFHSIYGFSNKIWNIWFRLIPLTNNKNHNVFFLSKLKCGR